MHPRGTLVLQQIERLLDQILVIEQPMPVLFGAESFDHLIGDGEQCHAAVPRFDCPLAHQQVPDPLLLLFEAPAKIWLQADDCVGHHPLLGLVALRGAENIEIVVEQADAAQLRHGLETAGLFLVRFRSLHQYCGYRIPFRFRDKAVVNDGCFDAFE